MSDIKNIPEPTQQPILAPEASAAQTVEKKEPEQQSNIPKWLPEPAKNAWQGIRDKINQWRTSTIMATPAFIVNNASNVLGASHVATEMLMFKSGMKDARLVNNPANPINWIKEPAVNIYKDIVTRGAARDYSLPQLFRGDVRKNFNTYIFDTHAASHREIDRQIAANRELVAAGKSAKKLSLGNPWQARTTGMGIAIWSLSTLIPERKESEEEIERMAKMRTLHPMHYIGTRLKQAIWFPEWNQHKREMLGLGYLGIGILSGIGSWRNRGKLDPAIAKDAELIARGVKEAYRFNSGYFATALVSFLAGLPLLFALDERKAYSTYGSISVLRIPALPSSLYSKMKNGEPGWVSYTIGKLTFQVEDFLFSLIGGATKRKKPDGTYEIIDHEALKKEAIAEAKEEKSRQKEEKHHLPTAKAEYPENPTAPTHTITAASQPERAMPERVQAEAETAHAV